MINNKTIPCIIGLGYVGLPLFIEIQKKFKTIGFDTNKKRITELKKKIDKNLEHKKKDLILKNNSYFTNKIDYIKKSNFYIICVPTPIFKNQIPNLVPVKKACEILGKIIKKDDIIILESTVYPGVTEKFCVPILEKKSGLKNNKDFFTGYSPERINPGDKSHSINKIKKILSFNNIGNLKKKIIVDVYKCVSKSLIYSNKIQESETAKLIENIQRDLNIGLMNEILQTCDKLKIDFQEVLRLAKTKWNFCNFQPGLVGGHCLPVDPYYLSYIAKKYNYKTSIILAGRNMNNNMVKFVKKKIIERIKKNNLLNKKFKILILGLTYKANVADFRNSLALKIYFILKKTYKNVYAFDHFYLEKQKKIKVERNINNLKKYDLIIPLVNHDKIKKKIIMLTKKNSKILDIFGFYKNY